MNINISLWARLDSAELVSIIRVCTAIIPNAASGNNSVSCVLSKPILKPTPSIFVVVTVPVAC